MQGMETTLASSAKAGSATIPLLEGPSGETVPGVFLNRARVLGARDYVHFWRGGEWRTLSWAETAEKVLAVAGALVEAGLRPGDHVALLSENRVEWLYCDLGIQAAGCVTVPIYPTSPPSVVRHIIEDAGALMVIASVQAARKLEPQRPLLRVALIEKEVEQWTKSALRSEARAEVEGRLAGLRPEHVATVIYTAGTTGKPKGVVLRHRNFVVMAARILEVFGMGEMDTILSFLPYAHVMERMDGIFVPSSAGCSIWLARGLSTLTEDIHAAQPTVMLGVPRVFEIVHQAVHDQIAKESLLNRAVFRWAIAAGVGRLSEAPGWWVRIKARLADRFVMNVLRRRLTGARLRFFISGGAPLNEKIEEFFWAIGVKILQGYGLTESTGGVTSNTEVRHRYRTVGIPVPGIQVSIAADGEVLVRGPAVMAGYKNRPEETAETIVDGWLKTGDIGYLDADGFLTITDRKKDLIKTSSGEYVAPLPIESHLQNDRYVKAAVVVGNGRPYAVALIVPDWKALAADHGFSGNPAQLVHDQRVRAFFQRLVDDCNRDQGSLDAIKRFALLEHDFSEDRDELTPTLKPKRGVIAVHFERLIEELYGATKPHS